MATGSTVASLLVKIGGDTADLLKKVKEAETGLEKFGRVAKGVGVSMTAVGTAGVAALGLMVRETVALGSAVYDASQRTGETAENITRLGYAAKQTGADMGSIETGLFRLARAMNEANTGNKETAETFARLGISVVGADGNLRSATDVMLDTADALQGITSDAEKAALAGEVFGRSAGPALLPMLKEGRAGIQAYMADADRLGITMSTETAEAADKVGDAMDAAKGAMAGARREIAVALLPAILKGTELFTGFAQILQKIPPGMALITAGIVALMVPVGLLLMAIPSLIAGFTLLMAHPLVLGIVGIGVAVGIIAAGFVDWSNAAGKLNAALSGVASKMDTIAALNEERGKYSRAAAIVNAPRTVAGYSQSERDEAVAEARTSGRNIQLLKGRLYRMDNPAAATGGGGGTNTGGAPTVTRFDESGKIAAQAAASLARYMTETEEAAKNAVKPLEVVHLKIADSAAAMEKTGVAALRTKEAVEGITYSVTPMSDAMQEMQYVGLNMADSFGYAFATVITGTQSATAAFHQFANAAIAELNRIIAKMVVMAIINAVTGGSAKGGSALSIGKVLAGGGNGGPKLPGSRIARGGDDVAPLSRLGRIGGRSQTVNVIMDSRIVASAAFDGAGDELNLRAA